MTKFWRLLHPRVLVQGIIESRSMKSWVARCLDRVAKVDNVHCSVACGAQAERWKRENQRWQYLKQIFMRYLIGYFLLSIHPITWKEFTSGRVDRGLQNMALFVSWF